MRITQLRILSLFLAVISTILLCVTVSTNRWYSVKANNVGRIAQLSYGLFYECLDGDCKPLKRNEGEPVLFDYPILHEIFLEMIQS